MRLLSLLTLPLLSLTFANPLPNAHLAALQLRDAANSLSSRTFFEHDWRCNNDWAKTDCKKKGGEWACDKSCVCVQKPVECNTYCPLRPLKKVACELKWGYDFDDDTCSCEKESPKCDDSEKKTAVCLKDQGWWNKDKCRCEGAKCPDCDGQGKDCGTKGGKWDEASCKCNMPPPPPTCPDSDKKKSTCAKDQGFWNKDKCQCEGPKCPDCDGQGKDCGSKGGKWDESSCKCTMPPPPPPPPTCPDSDHLKATCSADQGWWNKDTCCCDGAKCPDSATKEYNCVNTSGTWSKGDCKCTYAVPETPKPVPAKECGSWWSIWLCKLKGKGCDSGCNCY